MIYFSLCFLYLYKDPEELRFSLKTFWFEGWMNMLNNGPHPFKKKACVTCWTSSFFFFFFFFFLSKGYRPSIVVSALFFSSYCLLNVFFLWIFLQLIKKYFHSPKYSLVELFFPPISKEDFFFSPINLEDLLNHIGASFLRYRECPTYPRTTFYIWS